MAAPLLKWAAKKGISDGPSSSSSPLGHSLFVSHFPGAGGRGIAAARDLRRGEMILRVPRDVLLTSDNVVGRDKRIGDCVAIHCDRLSSTQILAACLLAEVGKGRHSEWHPYLVELPLSYSTLANFSQFEIQALQLEDAILVAEKAVNIAKLEWKEAIILLKELNLHPKLLTFRSWLWASATISSRTLHIPWDTAGCLCPVGDLFNYAAPSEDALPEDFTSLQDTASHCGTNILNKHKNLTESLPLNNAEQPDYYSKRLTDGGYEDSLSAYCFYARKSYKKGEQVLLGYGTYTNLDLLEHYGFMLEDNPNDKAFIQLSSEMCTSSSWPSDSLYIQPDGHPSFVLGCVLRLWATPKSLRKAVGHLVYTGSLLSAENEIAIMKWLIGQCKDILTSVRSAPCEDCSLLIAIEKIIDQPYGTKFAGWFCNHNELAEFFQKHGFQLENSNEDQMPTKVLRALERWKLSVMWRLSYKKMLLNCISYCEDTMHKLLDT